MKTVISTSMVTFLLLASGQTFAVGDSDCCWANDTPGCDTPGCEVSICSLDPFCCDAEWDSVCANQAGEFCAVCGGSSDCCIANNVPGCEIPSCVDCVCDIDPFCCTDFWDSICASEADGVCQDQCPCDTCGDGVCDFPGGDTCETCPLDCGVCPDRPCPTDLNGDGMTNAADLAILLGAWGPCE